MRLIDLSGILWHICSTMAKQSYKKALDIDALVKDIQKYLPKFDKKLFKKVFEFAQKAHEGQVRKDKKTPYFVHPVEVVKILAKLHADENTLMAALLHDVPEDTQYDLHDVKELAGEKVAFLVDGITKLSKVHYQHNMPERQVESLKKLFLHSAKDPRVIFIKLADRLHNMRTLEFVKPEKQLRIARETIEIFVPMANLLGIQDLKSELEDLCFKHLFPTEYEKMSNLLAKNREKNKAILKKFLTKLKNAFKKSDISAEVSERKQNLFTVYKKLSSLGKSLDDIEDRIAIRIIVDTIPKCYEALGILHGLFTPKSGKFKDYIANPKVNKYQSIHTMVWADGILTEAQIRTEAMHLEATYGVASNFFQEKPKIKKDERSSWMGKIVEMEKSGKASSDFIEELKLDVFQDRMFVFTPKGGAIDLPRGASAIDFAYAIHTEVGDHGVKAEINGNVMSVTSPLKHGDVVNILTDKKSNPRLSWLNFVKTSVAKNKIRSFLKRISKNQKIKEGQKILQKEFDIAGLGLLAKMNFKKMNMQLMKRLGRSFKSVVDLYTAIAEGEIKGIEIAKALKKSRKPSMDKGVKVNIKVLAKNRFGLLRDVSEVFYKHSMDMTYLKAWSSPDQDEAFFNVQVVVNDIENVEYIFDELEQIDDVRHVYRIPYKKVRLTYILIALTGLIWVFHPLLLRKLSQSEVVQQNPFNFSIMVNTGLFGLLLLILYINNLVKNHLPHIRNKKLLWVIWFGMPALAFFTLLLEIFYFELQLNMGAVVLELVLIYAYLIVSFLNFRKAH